MRGRSSPNTLQTAQRLTIVFRVNIPAGATDILQNDASAVAFYGSSSFRPTASASVVRTNVSLIKSVTDDLSPEPGEALTYTLVARNNGIANETSITLTDAIPPGTAFVAGSITSPAGFTGIYSAAQRAVVWTGGPLAPGATATFSFQATIDFSTSAGFVVTNQATYRSAQTPSFNSNAVNPTVVGPELTKVEVRAARSSTRTRSPRSRSRSRTSARGSATNVRIVDPLAASRTTYVAGTMSCSINGGSFIALTDAAADDQGTLNGTAVEFLLATLGPGSDVRFRFNARVNAGTGGQTVNNQAMVSSIAAAGIRHEPRPDPDRRQRERDRPRLPRLDGDGVQDTGGAQRGRRGGDRHGQQRPDTDAYRRAGNYLATVPAGSTQVDIDRTPATSRRGATPPTANDPQTLNAVANQTVAAASGLPAPALSISKASNAAAKSCPARR